MLTRRLLRGHAQRLPGANGLLVLVALGMLAYRFANLDLVPFINDEPLFLDAANEQLRSGRWACASPIAGTQGATYGPTVIWFYGLVQLLLSARPETSILAMCLLVTISQGALAFALTRLFRGDAVSLAAVLAFVAASPYQFFWSRLAWDQMVVVCASWIVVVLALPHPMGWGRGVLLGLLAGLATSSHLMALPFVVLVLATLAAESMRDPRSLVRSLAPVLVGAVLVNLPYLAFLRAHPPALQPAAGSFSWPLLARHLLEPPRVASTWQLAHFFDGEWPDFLRWVGGAGRWALQRAVWSAAGMAAVSAVGLVVTMRSKDPGQRRIAGLALAVWLGYALFYTARGLDRQPHYQFPTWWVVPAGVAGGLAALSIRSRRLARVASLVVLAGSGAQFLVNVSWMGYIRERGGTRGLHYSSPLSAQRQVVRRLCEGASGSIALENHTVVLPVSLSYVARTTPACQGVTIRLCSPGTCPELASARRLRYASPAGGALVLE